MNTFSWNITKFSLPETIPNDLTSSTKFHIVFQSIEITEVGKENQNTDTHTHTHTHTHPLCQYKERTNSNHLYFCLFIYEKIHLFT